MPKLSSQPITAQDVKQYLGSQDDFGLEMQALRACKDNGFEVSHGGSYTDPVTKKTRQYDLRAFFHKTKRKKVQLAIECKSLKTYFPLIVSRIPRTLSESYHEIVVSHKPLVPKNAFVSASLETTTTFRVTSPNSVYVENEPVGKATAQIGKSPAGEFVDTDAEVFDKWSQALASADNMIRESGSNHERHNEPCFFTLTLPVLVVSDGTLWAADYDASGAPVSDPRQVEECTIYIGKEYWTGPGFGAFRYTISHLHILTLTKLKGYLSRLVVNDHHWSMLFPEEKLQDAFVHHGYADGTT